MLEVVEDVIRQPQVLLRVFDNLIELVDVVWVYHRITKHQLDALRRPVQVDIFEHSVAHVVEVVDDLGVLDIEANCIVDHHGVAHELLW